MERLQSLYIYQHYNSSADWSAFFDKVYSVRSPQIVPPSNVLEEVNVLCEFSRLESRGMVRNRQLFRGLLFANCILRVHEHMLWYRWFVLLVLRSISSIALLQDPDKGFAHPHHYSSNVLHLALPQHRRLRHLPHELVPKLHIDHIPSNLLLIPIIYRIGLHDISAITSFVNPQNHHPLLNSHYRSTFCWHFVVCVIAEDVAHYFLHRLLHVGWLYTKIHKLHHQFAAPFGLAAAYAHPLEVLVLGFATFLGPLLVRPHFFTFYCWVLYRQLDAVGTHCGYDLPNPTNLIPYYGGTTSHDYHHKSFIWNYSSRFTFMDHIFGTYKEPV